MEDDWDLHAVVRGCTTTVSSASSSCSSAVTTTTTVSSSSSSSAFNFPVFVGPEKVGQVLSLSSDLDPFEARTIPPSATAAATSSSIEELHELCKPFFSKSASSSSSSFSYNKKPVQTTQQNLQTKHKTMSHAAPLSTATRSNKRRKNQLKKVCQVPAESLSSDIWAWRKYGQKPIKGSPYPRGYYRCSSSKGCLARKQVERNRSDPTMFIVTYTAEHNHPAPTHRNSLAGSTRQKPSTSPSAAVPSAAEGGDSDKTTAKPSSPATSGVEEEQEELAPHSTEPESKVEMEDLMDEEEDDEFGLSDTALTDDFFDGLDELAGPPLPPAVATVAGDCFPDPFSASSALPAWAANNTAAAAAAAAAAFSATAGGNY